MATEQAVGHFAIPIYLDLAATFVFALTGAIGAIQRRYDYVGVLVIAVLSGVGGSLMRDGLFIQQGPPVAIADGRYFPVIVTACFVGAMVTRLRRGIQGILVAIDAFGLGAYAMVGTQASFDAGIGPWGAAFVGMLNAVGGSVLRDVTIREEPMILKPGEHYAGAALAGALVFIALDMWAMPRVVSGTVGIAVTFAIRMASVYLGLRTRPLASLGWLERPAMGESDQRR